MTGPNVWAKVGESLPLSSWWWWRCWSQWQQQTHAALIYVPESIVLYTFLTHLILKITLWGGTVILLYPFTYVRRAWSALLTWPETIELINGEFEVWMLAVKFTEPTFPFAFLCCLSQIHLSFVLHFFSFLLCFSFHFLSLWFTEMKT